MLKLVLSVMSQGALFLTPRPKCFYSSSSWSFSLYSETPKTIYTGSSWEWHGPHNEKENTIIYGIKQGFRGHTGAHCPLTPNEGQACLQRRQLWLPAEDAGKSKSATLPARRGKDPRVLVLFSEE